ncbi:hypothetical protein BC829DRAFT_40239 [Chytridium lagenaria]|nr:hypothetical protein BC829DRAFT_40239 [Chytridium lagenaria]
MDAILGRFKVFSRLPPSHRYKLYNSCKLHTYSRNTSLIHESHSAKQMYILLLGECLLQIRPNHPTASVNLRLGVGGAAGEFQTFALNEVRNMRAVCTMRTLVMVIDKGEFVTVAREARTVDNYVAEFFATVPSLLSADKQLPVFLSQRGIVRRYDPKPSSSALPNPAPTSTLSSAENAALSTWSPLSNKTSAPPKTLSPPSSALTLVTITVSPHTHQPKPSNLPTNSSANSPQW